MDYNYDNLVVALQDLKKRGYTEDLNLKPDCLHCAAMELNLFTDEFEIDEMHRFEGDTDPGNSSILYAISSKNYGIKGVLINAYGVYADPMNGEMIEKLSVRDR